MLTGKILSEGLAVGIVYKLEAFEYKYQEKSVEPAQCEEELKRFYDARAESETQIKELQSKAETEWGEEKAEIFDGYLEIILDEELEEEVVEIIKTGTTADCALYQVISPQIEVMKNKKDEYLAERASDMQDILDRFLKNILGIRQNTELMPSDAIICVKELTPSETACLDMNKVKAIVVNTGGPSSHAAIMARTLSLPLMLIEKPVEELVENTTVLINATEGHIVENPTDEEIENFKAAIADHLEYREYLKTLINLPAQTVDGKKIKLFSNIGSESEIDQVIEFGAEGIGLFRTEFLFMGRDSSPSEENQFRVYKNIAEQMSKKPVIIRTFDFGGDKQIPYLNLPREENPFLGKRSVRLYEKEFELFAIQVRAIVRAAAYGNLKIMFPLISSVDELKKIIKLTEKAVEPLTEKEKAVYRKMEKGIMIETPSSALLAEHLIKYCDFFSIGSNDLTQYTIAVDRGNPDLMEMFDPFIPAVIKLINMAVRAAHKAEKWVGICGELGSDINGALILAGWDIDEISITPPVIPHVKEAVRKVPFYELQKLAECILEKESSEEILTEIYSFRRKYDV
ncbi:MAG: phosphoenolpyruvate--protein phosphotransferase [Victivallales bacterium]|nr:phosphoenolpyruvate--protein phosphotransferase [Victivallales bacterium]MCF7889221.1 phosphoenolpyruvate--protein phosphotransferase [Victivallales bacterium]